MVSLHTCKFSHSHPLGLSIIICYHVFSMGLFLPIYDVINIKPQLSLLTSLKKKTILGVKSPMETTVAPKSRSFVYFFSLFALSLLFFHLWWKKDEPVNDMRCIRSGQNTQQLPCCQTTSLRDVKRRLLESFNNSWKTFTFRLTSNLTENVAYLSY